MSVTVLPSLTKLSRESDESALDHYCDLITNFVRILWEGLSQLMRPVRRTLPIRPKCVGLALEERLCVSDFTGIPVMLWRRRQKKRGKQRQAVSPPTSLPHKMWISPQTAALVPLQWGGWTPQLWMGKAAEIKGEDRSFMEGKLVFGGLVP